MKVALVSSFDLDGGAARAAYRLLDAIVRAGVDARLFVQVRSAGDVRVDGPSGGVARIWARLRPHLDHLPARRTGATLGAFSVNWLPAGIAGRLAAFAPDLVHWHGLHAGFASVREIERLGRPAVWTAHDMWPFTGGCHYDEGCGGFETRGCSPCPQQHARPAAPLAARRLHAKVQAAQRGRLAFVTPSRWLADVAARSPVARERPVHVIPNGLDLERFRPIDRTAARALFGLPAERVVLLFGAVHATSDRRKGYDLLDAALARLQGSPWRDRVVLAVYGGARGRSSVHGVPAYGVGQLHDEESLIALYSAADVFVAPSRQDNLPNTVLEATACALPTVGFATGGIPDLVEDGVTGWLAQTVDADALYAALERALQDPARRAAAGQAARARAVERFSDAASALEHRRLYAQLIEQARR
ncbi:glycosyltransferase [Rubrivivax gelatinosus]|uniref:Glycosyltransferase subfamily 4-like N-terminal domain-containing protein n=1 Tax=Rubrivivax gelatinosus TaxID=28068 RepID=A0ABS1DTI5_RUBGE|nr:glycosyltransferase [Rubrivivax gelatinosus]MBK1712490.1 hypothetical protein [Rubrivivax gelatinosus]